MARRNLIYGSVILLLALVPLLRSNIQVHDGPLGMAAHLQLVRMVHQSPPQLVLLGDSLTWMGQFRVAKDYGVTMANLGRPGDIVEDLRWRVTHGELDTNPQAAIIMIGINNLSRGDDPLYVATQIDGLVADVRASYPDIRILLLGILVSGKTPDHPMRQKIQAVNQQMERTAATYHTLYRDISPHFMHPDGNLKLWLYLDDHLHLRPRAYDVWAEAIRGDVKALLAPAPDKTP